MNNKKYNDNINILYFTTDIVSNYISKNKISHVELLNLIKVVYNTIKIIKENNYNISNKIQLNSPEQTIYPDYIICLEDGKKLKMLKRYLKTKYNLTPEAYCLKWNLPINYPMVAPNYSIKRSKLAKKTGLGRIPNKKKA